MDCATVWIRWALWVALAVSPVAGRAAVTNLFGGAYANWPTVWTSLGLDDPDDGLANDYVDIVGDATDPAAFWAKDASYTYFRIRLDVGTFDPAASNARDTWLVMVDAQNYVYPDGATNRPDYAFAFDLKGEQSQPGQHGLEMTHINTTGNAWQNIRFDDVDTNAAQKIAPPDFANTGGNGYVRATDNVATTNFGTTTFLDFAISSAYLGANVANLWSNGQWRIQFATIDNANDHNLLGADVAGNQSPNSTILESSWSAAITIPEPPAGIAGAPLVGLAVLGLLRGRRARRRRDGIVLRR